MFNQTQARAVRPLILEQVVKALIATFPELYDEQTFYQTEEGMAFVLPQDAEGDTCGVLNVKIKKTEDYDIFDAHDIWLEKQKKKEETAKAAAARKAKDIAKKAKEKEEREALKLQRQASKGKGDGAV